MHLPIIFYRRSRNILPSTRFHAGGVQPLDCFSRSYYLPSSLFKQLIGLEQLRLTSNMIAWNGIFQLLDGVSFSSRQPLFTNETRLMKPAMRRARRSEDLPLTLL
ncbi:hypothetical protein T08_15442 [Trichinella sp. T8]|nr:hypothetical protein T08_15442 [Trichinella sp. T8]